MIPTPWDGIPHVDEPKTGNDDLDEFLCQRKTEEEEERALRAADDAAAARDGDEADDADAEGGQYDGRDGSDGSDGPDGPDGLESPPWSYDDSPHRELLRSLRRTPAVPIEELNRPRVVPSQRAIEERVAAAERQMLNARLFLAVKRNDPTLAVEQLLLEGASAQAPQSTRTPAPSC